MSNRKPTPLVAAAIAGSLLVAGGALASTPLAQGYALGAAGIGKSAEGNCGEGKCGGAMANKPAEGGCGMDKMDTNKDGKISREEFAAAHGGKDDKFAAHDGNKDGFISAAEMKAHHEAKGGEGKCGEGKCGEGKCGSK